VRLIFKIKLVEIIVFTEARDVKTTEAAASVASNVAVGLYGHDNQNEMHIAKFPAEQNV